MRKLFWQAAGLILTAAMTIVVVACMSSPAPEASAGPPTVALGSNDKLGTFLVDGQGKTLYMFTKDTKDVSNCYGGCATAWPPLLVTDKVVLGKGLMASLESTTTRKDGAVQVTYAGWPLYYFQKDQAAGDVAGQGVGQVWWLVAADGSLIKTMP